MGRHTGPAAAPQPVPRKRLAVLALGTTLTLIAWGFLVWEAIDFGAKARDGESPAWAFLAVATLGATACLLVTLILVSKVFATLRGEARSRPTVSGGHRAAR
jgi:hypothetical protein